MKNHGLIKWLLFFYGVFNTTFASDSPDSLTYYSLEMTRESNIKLAREQASIASGMLSYPCRLLNEVGTYVALCGKLQNKAAFSIDIKRLHQLGFDKIKLVKVSANEVVLATYQPITLDEKSQQYLLDIAQKQSFFKLETTNNAKKAEHPSDLFIEQELFQQGKYFLDRGWQALLIKDNAFALNMFQLATQIESSKWEAIYGLAQTSVQQENWSQALFYFEDLYQQNYLEATLLQQVVNSAFNAGEFTKARLYVEQLASDERIEWRKRLRGEEMSLELAAFSKSTTAADLVLFKKNYQSQLNDCNPFLSWLDFVDYAKKKQQKKLSIEVLKELLDYCHDNDKKLTILYRLKALIPERQLIQVIKNQQAIADKSLSINLRKTHLETLLQLASKLNNQWPEQQAIIHEALVLDKLNIDARLMLAWNHYHQKEYLEANQLFNLLWQKYKRRKALEGLLFSMAAIGKIDDAIELATEHKMAPQRLSLLKTKLGDQAASSQSALITAQSILQLDPLYLPAHQTIGWYYINHKQWSEFEKAYNAWQNTFNHDQLALRPEPVSMTNLHGWAYYLRGQYSKAFNSFADAYLRAQTSEEEESAVKGLLYSSYQSSNWSGLLQLTKDKPGLLLSNKQERDTVNRLAAGSLVSSQITVRNGYFEALPITYDTSPEKKLDLIEGLPGFTWGSIRDDFSGDNTVSYLVNQGIDWMILPGDFMLNSFVEYRAINNEFHFLNEDTEAVIGIDFYHKPFHLGVEYILDHWQEENKGRYYLSWYHDWYKYIRRRGKSEENWLAADAYSGSTYARLTRNFEGGTNIQGYVSQGVDWFTFADDITFNTSLSYRFRFRNFDNEFYNAHGPSIALELQKAPFTLGIDYSWSKSPSLGTSEHILGLYFRWYYGWDLK